MSDAAAARRPAPPQKLDLPGVTHVIAVSSGKGGVGKSTTAVNLALALVAEGYRVGLMDADVYGPSVPKLLALHGKPRMIDQRRMAPLEAHGLAAMSIGFLIGEEQPMVWRGPMVMQAVTQLVRDVAWGRRDVLVVDMPPGTGDAQLTLAQVVPLAGAVVVSTPQDLALIDARRGLAMFRRVDVPILGIVENMSFFLCPRCDTRSDVFGHGGAREEAERLEVPFLGEVPLDPELRRSSDAGLPIVVSNPDGAHARAYRRIAREMLSRAEDARKPPPRIVIE
jgi:ATP-binding protein involved in chromosome partitioning